MPATRLCQGRAVTRHGCRWRRKRSADEVGWTRRWRSRQAAGARGECRWGSRRARWSGDRVAAATRQSPATIPPRMRRSRRCAMPRAPSATPLPAVRLYSTLEPCAMCAGRSCMRGSRAWCTRTPIRSRGCADRCLILRRKAAQPSCDGRGGVRADACGALLSSFLRGASVVRMATTTAPASLRLLRAVGLRARSGGDRSPVAPSRRWATRWSSIRRPDALAALLGERRRAAAAVRTHGAGSSRRRRRGVARRYAGRACSTASTSAARRRRKALGWVQRLTAFALPALAHTRMVTFAGRSRRRLRRDGASAFTLEHWSRRARRRSLPWTARSRDPTRIAPATLWGGNLAMSRILVGTPHLRADGRHPLSRRRGRTPYRIERMLLQLHQAGHPCAPARGAAGAASRSTRCRTTTAAMTWRRRWRSCAGHAHPRAHRPAVRPCAGQAHAGPWAATARLAVAATARHPGVLPLCALTTTTDSPCARGVAARQGEPARDPHRGVRGEQNVPEELEWDGIDPSACMRSPRIGPVRHRLRPAAADGHIGRMAVLSDWRGAGVGATAPQFPGSSSPAPAATGEGDPERRRKHAVPFYARFGFAPEATLR